MFQVVLIIDFLLSIAGFASMFELASIMFAAGSSHPIFLVVIGRFIIEIIFGIVGFVLVFTGTIKFEKMLLKGIVNVFGLDKKVNKFSEDKNGPGE